MSSGDAPAASLTRAGGEPVQGDPPLAGRFRDWPRVVREREAVESRAPTPRLLDQVQNAIRTRHSSRRTEKAYTGLEAGCDIQANHELRGHRDVTTTMIYTQVPINNRGGRGGRNPLDRA